MSSEFLEVTELSNEPVSNEQIKRAITRYQWALPYCEGKSVLELACGSGPGLGLIASRSTKLVAGDISEDIVNIAKNHYGEEILISKLDALNVSANDASFDTIILFEALYYLEDPDKFLEECRRLLKKDGILLIATANKDLYDFNPSKYSFKYHGIVELDELLIRNSFRGKYWGNLAVKDVSLRQKMFRPIKKMAVTLNLIPKTFKGKELIKRMVFGELQSFPKEITKNMLFTRLDLEPIDVVAPNTSHKVILCAAKLINSHH